WPTCIHATENAIKTVLKGRHEMNNSNYREKIKKSIVFTEEAVDILEISRQAFYKHVKNGRIVPVRKVSRSAVYLKDDVLKLREELKPGRTKHLPYLFNAKNKRIEKGEKGK